MIETAPVWPSVQVVHGMLRGWRGIFLTSTGQAVSGLRSIHPWVYYAFNCGAACERCGTLEKPPDPPTSRGLNGKAEPIFGTQTKDYALFLLSWLHTFARKHEWCPEPVEAAA